MNHDKPWRVAIVGTGPAAMYSVEHLLEHNDIDFEIDLYERLPHPWGLVRNGVAADHPYKKAIVDRSFAFYFADRRVRFYGAVEIGRDVTHAELSEWYDAVIYCVGANSDNKLNIPGEELSGCWAARDFVSWCNGHLDFSDYSFDLSSRRALIIGNGNVALDVARMLTLPHADLKRTDLADHALEALLASRIEEVVLIGRRGPEHGAFHNPELEELEHLDGVDVAIEPLGFDESRAMSPEGDHFDLVRKLRTLDRIRLRQPSDDPKRMILRFMATPVAIEGSGKVERTTIALNRPQRREDGSITTIASGETAVIECGLVVRAAGYRVTAFPDLPFDEKRNVIANNGGRVQQDGVPLAGVYVTGWAKRGCKGVIGSNKKCARESVDALVSDIVSGQLRHHSEDPDLVRAKVMERCPQLVSRAGWNNINRNERDAGRVQGRPRVKVTKSARMLELSEGKG